MAKFGKKSKTSQDIPTAALPDIIFMLLFFFMVTTVMRETDILVKQILPKAIQLSKLDNTLNVTVFYNIKNGIRNQEINFTITRTR